MQKILIASVLKPVSDTRMYAKIGQTLAENKEFSVIIVGYSSTVPFTKKIKFYPLFKFKRISFKRILAPWKVLHSVLKEKPAVFIITTYELLFQACLFKLLLKGKIIYDIQENYYRNRLYMKTIPVPLHRLLALWVRMKEKFFAPFFDGFLLAEKIYAQQLPFIQGKGRLILENKFLESGNFTPRKTPVKFSGLKKLDLVYTGTVSEEYGVLDAIQFVEGINRQKGYRYARLLILGYAAHAKFAAAIAKACSGLDFVKVAIQAEPVPHTKIVEAQQKADFVLLPYRANKAMEGKIPTKFYEALALHIPVITSKNRALAPALEKYKAGIEVDFRKPDYQNIVNILDNEVFYTDLPKNEVLWSAEKKQLFRFILEIL